MRQPIQRLLMLRARNLCGPFFQRIGTSTWAHSAGNFLASIGARLPWTGTTPYCCLDFADATLEPQSGNPNDVTVDFTRASTATVVDFEGRVIEVLENEARFQGARRVENLQYVPLDAFSIKTNCTAVVSGEVLEGKPVYEINVIADGWYLGDSPGTPGWSDGDLVNVSCWAKGAVGGELLRFHVSALGISIAGEVTLTNEWKRYSLPSRGYNSGIHRRFVCGGLLGNGDVIYISGVQVELTQGQSNQNPSEFVANPGQHGAGVDGVKYFPYRNGNTVDANGVVTERKGAALPDVAYLNEPAATNLCVTPKLADWNAYQAGVGQLPILTANYEQGPYGLADRIQCVNAGATSNGDYSFVMDALGLLAAGIYSYSLYVKLNQPAPGVIYFRFLGGDQVTRVTLKKQGVWERIQLTVESDGTKNLQPLIGLRGADSSPTLDISVCAPQAEESTTPTSYIPTAGAAVTRAEDRLIYGNMDIHADFSFAFDGEILETVPDYRLRLFGTYDDRGVNYEARTAGNVGASAWEIGTANFQNRINFNIDRQLVTAGTKFKFAGGRSDNRAAAYYDGEQKYVAELTFGSDHSNTGNWGIGNWTAVTALLIRSFKLFNECVPDDELASLTSKDWSCPPAPPLPTADYLCGPGGWTDLGAWDVNAVAYGPCKVVSHLGRWFVAHTGHTPSSVSEPGVGASWRSYWYEIQDPVSGLAMPTPTLGMAREHDELAEALAMKRALQQQLDELVAAEAHTDELAAMQASIDQWYADHAPLRPGQPLPRSSWPSKPTNLEAYPADVLAQWLKTYAYQRADRDEAYALLRSFSADHLRGMILGSVPLPWVQREPEPHQAPVPEQVKSIDPPQIQQSETEILLQKTPDELREWMLREWYYNNPQIRQYIYALSDGQVYEQIMAHSM